MKLTHLKNPLFTFLLLAGGLPVFARNTRKIAPGIAPVAVNDSIKKLASPPKIRIVEGAAMSSANDIIQNIAVAKDFSIFLKAINNAGLEETFSTTGPITVFAPVNSAFEKLPAGKTDTLLGPKNKLYLTSLLTYHAIVGKISSKDIEKQIKAGNGQATYITLAGGKLTASINQNRNIVLTDENGGQSVISSFDIEQSNGMLHVINAVLIPKDKL